MSQHVEQITERRPSMTAQEALTRTRAQEVEWSTRRATRVRQFVTPLGARHRAN